MGRGRHVRLFPDRDVMIAAPEDVMLDKLLGGHRCRFTIGPSRSGDFHHSRQRWISALTDALNGGGLPPEFVALAEQVTGRPIPDVVTLQAFSAKGSAGGIAVAPTSLPSARVIQKFERINYAKRADRVVIRRGRGRVVAIIEMLSPGNKDSRHAIRLRPGSQARLFANAPFAAPFAGISRIDGSNQRG
jgi:hypothetical protein